MKFSHKSQSLIELTTLFVLIAVGIILIRPYVIRAINAHFKTWEETIEDSTKEEMQEAVITDLPAPPVCSDGVCAAGFEDVIRCCQDCGTCGDGHCCSQKNEDNSASTNYCPQDCGTCGDTICTPERNEDVNTCCTDCGTCNDGVCCTDLGPDVAGGTPIGSDTSCTGDCPQAVLCPNGTCDPGEDTTNCCLDCHGVPACPDGFCCTESGESIDNCSDCGVRACECLNQSECDLRPDCCYGSPGAVDPCSHMVLIGNACHTGACTGNPCAGVNCSLRGDNQGACCAGDCCSLYYNVAGQNCHKCRNWTGSCRVVVQNCDNVP